MGTGLCLTVDHLIRPSAALAIAASQGEFAGMFVHGIFRVQTARLENPCYSAATIGAAASLRTARRITSK